MSDDNLANFIQSGNDLEIIYQKLWSAKAVLSLLEDRFAQEFNGELVQICFVLTEMLDGMEVLLPEM